MGKETEILSGLRIDIQALNENIKHLIKYQLITNNLLEQLVRANQAFLGTLTSFLDLDHRLKMDQERKRLEQAKSVEPTKHDLLY